MRSKKKKAEEVVEKPPVETPGFDHPPEVDDSDFLGDETDDDFES